MANKTIPQLSGVTAVAATDEMEVHKSGEATSKKATVAQVLGIEATAREEQDNVIEASCGLNTDGTYPTLAQSWYLRAADFVTGLVQRDGAVANVTQTILNAIRMLDSKIHTIETSSVSSIRTVSVLCSTADILSCNGVPKVLIAGETDRTHEILSIVAVNQFNTTAFEAGTDKLQIKYNGGETMFEFSNAFLETAVTAINRGVPTTNAVLKEAASIVMYCASAPSLGDGVIRFIITYRTHETGLSD